MKLKPQRRDFMKRGLLMANYNGFCRYCNRVANGGKEICCDCKDKLPLVRTIHNMLRPTYEKKKAKKNKWRFWYD